MKRAVKHFPKNCSVRKKKERERERERFANQPWGVEGVLVIGKGSVAVMLRQ